MNNIHVRIRDHMMSETLVVVILSIWQYNNQKLSNRQYNNKQNPWQLITHPYLSTSSVSHNIIPTWSDCNIKSVPISVAVGRSMRVPKQQQQRQGCVPLWHTRAWVCTTGCYYAGSVLTGNWNKANSNNIGCYSLNQLSKYLPFTSLGIGSIKGWLQIRNLNQ